MTEGGYIPESLKNAAGKAASALGNAASKVAVKAAGAVAKNGPASVNNAVQRAAVSLKTNDQSAEKLVAKQGNYSALEVAKSLEIFLQAKDQGTANRRFDETTRLMRKYVEYVVMQNGVQDSFSYTIRWGRHTNWA